MGEKQDGGTFIGCELYLVKDGKFLMGKRKNQYGSGTYGLAGGHLDFLERADECAVRELEEETGIVVKPSDLTLLAVTDDINPDTNNHYVHLTFRYELAGQEPENREPDYCEGWEWFSLDDLPDNVFPPHSKILATIRSGKTYKAA